MSRSPVVVAIVLVALAACNRPRIEAPVAATTDRGAIAFAGVEQWLHASGKAPASESPDDLLAAFEEGAREIAARELLAPDGAAELARAISDLGQDAEKIRHRIVVELYRAAHPEAVALPSDADIAAAYAADPERFHRPAQRFVWHLLLRIDPGVDPETVLDQARELKRRIEAGASFASVAREYSRSETRALGGRLGVIPAGRLPAALEKIVFALREGEVSEPVRNRDDVLLFQATDVIAEKRFPLADVKWVLARELFAERRRKALAERAGDAALPEDSKVLDSEALRRALALGDGEVVLRVGELTWSVSELRKAIRARRESGWVAMSPIEELDQAYAEWVDSERTYELARREGFAVASASLIAERQAEALRGEIAHRKVEERIEALAAGRRGELERFYRDNSFLYQSPLRLRLRMLSVPLGDDPGARLAELETARGELAAGRLALEDLARRLEGEVRDAGWSTARDLEQFEPKIRFLLGDMGSTGFTVPFQFNQRLSIVQVLERVEPTVLPYGEVADAVRRDYVDRQRQALRREVVEQVLRDGGFEFHAAAVRERLGLAAATGTK